MIDTLGLVVHDLRLRQLDVLLAEMPEAFADHEIRMSAAMTNGLAIVHDLAESQPQLRDLMTQIVVLADQDPRLSFLQAIPEGPILAMMRATALERALFDTETREVAELALLIGIFTVMLDGMLDEVPEMSRPIKPWLDRTMSLDLEHLEPPAGLHPVAAALVWSVSTATGRFSRLSGWQDPLSRREFTRATAAAYATELESVSCRITDRAVLPAHQRSRIVSKSSTCIWAGALIPTLVHGWPSNLDPRRFESLAKAIGEFGGWIDDIVDLDVDLKADRWSMPLLEIFDMVALFDVRALDARDRRMVLAEGLQHPFIAGRLPGLGRDRLNRVRDALDELGIPEGFILPTMADVARACLLDSLVPA